MKKRFLVLLMVLALCVTMVLTGCKDGDKPDDSPAPKDEITLNGSIEKTFSAIFGAEDDSIALLESALNKGKITIALGDQLENVLYLDASNKAFANNLSLSAEGQSLSLGIYGKDKELAIAAPELLGDTAYGVNLATLATDLKDSAIWSLMGTDYDSFMSEYSKQIEQILGVFENVDEEAINEMVEDLAADISEALNDAEVTTKEVEVEVYGKKVKASVITYHMEKEDIEKIIDIMIDWMEEVMEGFMDSMKDVVGENVDLGEADSVEDMFGQVRTEIDTAFESVEIEGDFYAYINSKTQYVMQMGVEMTATVEGETGVVDMAFVLGEDPTKSKKCALIMEVEADGEKRTMEISLAIDEKTEGDVKTTTYTLAADMEGEKEEIVLAFAHDQKEHGYELSLEVDGIEISVSGDLEITDTKLHFSIDELEADGETVPLGLAITIEAGVEGMPAMPTYSNVLKLSESELGALMKTLEQVAPEMPDGSYNPDYPSYPSDPDWGNTENPAIGTGTLPVTVYDENGIKLTFTSLEKNNSGDYRISYEITNNTSGEITFSTDNCSVNGVTVNLYIYEEVEPGKTVAGDEMFYKEELRAAGVSEIRNIKCYDGQIMDTEDFDYEYAVAFELDCGDLLYTEKPDLSGEVIYDDNDIKLIYKGTQDDGDGDKISTILFVNNSGKDLTIDMDDFVVNDKECDKFNYGYAYAGTVGYIDTFWFESDIEDFGGELETISFVMGINDLMTYDTYEEDIQVSFKF